MKLLLFAAVIILLQTEPVYAQADRCRDILIYAAKNELRIKSDRDIDSATKTWFCSSSFDQYLASKDDSFGLDVFIKSFQAAFSSKSTSNKSQESRRKFCSQSGSRFTNFESNQIFRQVVSPIAVENWSKCMRGKQRSSLVDLDYRRLSPAAFTISARFNPNIEGLNAPMLYEMLVSSGVKCNMSRFRFSRKVPMQGVNIPCSQKKGTPAYVILQTSYGDFDLSVPADFTGLKAGVATPIYSTSRSEWVYAGTRSTRQETGNHHCESDCTGEPTRTTYVMRVSTRSKDERLSGTPNLRCIAGPCGGWNHINYVRKTKKTATASFDVWSRETAWELVVGYQRRKRSVARHRKSSIQLYYDKPFEIAFPSKSKNRRIEIRHAGRKDLYNLDNPGGQLQILSRRKIPSGISYRLQFVPQ